MSKSVHIVVKNPSKSLINLVEKAAYEKDAKRREAVARYQNGEIKQAEIIKI